MGLIGSRRQDVGLGVAETPDKMLNSREHVNRNRAQQKIRNKRGRTRIFLGHALTEEQGHDRDRGEERAVERAGRIVSDCYEDAADGTQHSSGQFENGDQCDKERNHGGEGTLGEMAGQPIEVPAPIDHLVDARLQEQDGQH